MPARRRASSGRATAAAAGLRLARSSPGFRSGLSRSTGRVAGFSQAHRMACTTSRSRAARWTWLRDQPAKAACSWGCRSPRRHARRGRDTGRVASGDASATWTAIAIATTGGERHTPLAERRRPHCARDRRSLRQAVGRRVRKAFGLDRERSDGEVRRDHRRSLVGPRRTHVDRERWPGRQLTEGPRTDRRRAGPASRLPMAPAATRGCSGARPMGDRPSRFIAKARWCRRTSTSRSRTGPSRTWLWRRTDTRASSGSILPACVRGDDRCRWTDGGGPALHRSGIYSAAHRRG